MLRLSDLQNLTSVSARPPHLVEMKTAVPAIAHRLPQTVIALGQDPEEVGVQVVAVQVETEPVAVAPDRGQGAALAVVDQMAAAVGMVTAVWAAREPAILLQ